jgi:hypothetical protein
VSRTLGRDEVSDAAFEHLGGHGDGFREGWVRMDGQANILGIRAYLDRQRGTSTAYRAR